MIVGNVGVNLYECTIYQERTFLSYIRFFPFHEIFYWYNEILIDKIIICLVGAFSIQLLYQILG